MQRRPVSGAQHVLRAGAYDAAVASVGASLRTVRHRGRDLVVPFDEDGLRPAYRGATLAPWPNRVVDGRYRFAGADYQLPLTEPARSHALHGLAAWSEFHAVSVADDGVVLATTIEPQAGYPWRVRVETTYALDAEGLTQTVTGTNVGSAPAPWGTGPHPYLVAGPGPLDTWALELPAQQVLHVTPDRLAPVELGDVRDDPARFDFRSPRPIGPVSIDHAYTDLLRDPSGMATVSITDPSGSGVALSWDAACAWVQIHTADLPDSTDAGHRAGLAVEPMTCAPDAFNSERYSHGTGLVVLPPGGSTSASWRIRALGSASGL